MNELLNFPDRKLWLEWRHGGIGSSDASVIMDVSRFKSKEELRVEKSMPFTGEDQANTYIKDRGNKIEIFVRTALEDKHNTTYYPLNCSHEGINFMKASLDGISEDRKTIIEIKLLTVVNPDKINTNTEGYKKWQSAYENNKVPDEYYPQVQHQLMITGAEKCLFIGYKEVKGRPSSIEGNLAIVEVFPDKEYIDQLAKKEFEFWWSVQKRINERKELA